MKLVLIGLTIVACASGVATSEQKEKPKKAEGLTGWLKMKRQHHHDEDEELDKYYDYQEYQPEAPKEIKWQNAVAALTLTFMVMGLAVGAHYLKKNRDKDFQDRIARGGSACISHCGKCYLCTAQEIENNYVDIEVSPGFNRPGGHRYVPGQTPFEQNLSHQYRQQLAQKLVDATSRQMYFRGHVNCEQCLSDFNIRYCNQCAPIQEADSNEEQTVHTQTTHSMVLAESDDSRSPIDAGSLNTSQHSSRSQHLPGMMRRKSTPVESQTGHLQPIQGILKKHKCVHQEKA